MNGTGIEDRTPMMALAEVSWEDQSGTSCHAPARIEDTSPSGVCIRVKTPIHVGSKLAVAWYREQFSGVVRNCRADGGDFVLGILRDKSKMHVQTNARHREDNANQTPVPVELAWRDQYGTVRRAQAELVLRSSYGAFLRLKTPIAIGCRLEIKSNAEPFSGVIKSSRRDGDAYLLGIRCPTAEYQALAGLLANKPLTKPPRFASQSLQRPSMQQDVHEAVPSAPATEPEAVLTSSATVPNEDRVRVAISLRPGNLPRIEFQSPSSPPSQERKVMRSHWLRPKFWRRRQNGSHAPGNSAPEAPTMIAPGQNSAGSQGDLMPCEDIYHAAGILSPTSGYGIDKVLQMLNSDHIRALPKEVKRASVLMALDAAGATPDEVLRDAAQRQQALDAYEASRRKQFAEFEARRAQENAAIQAEMERVTAHYLDRIKQNLDLVAREKNALRNWQSMKQQENQRITEVMGLCSKQLTSASSSDSKRPVPGTPVSLGPA